MDENVTIAKENKHGGEIVIRKDDSFGLILYFPYNPLHIQAVKRIPGHRWDPVKKYWLFTNSNGLLEKLL